MPINLPGNARERAPNRTARTLPARSRGTSPQTSAPAELNPERQIEERRSSKKPSQWRVDLSPRKIDRSIAL